MKGTPEQRLRYRLAVASRVLAAVIGGYTLTSAITVLLALVWPLPRAEAVAAATLLSFALYAVVILWIFSAQNLRTVWGVLILATGASSVLAWALLPGAG
ncbi:hypothetical protein ACMDCT_11290 [Halomonadaceae bacterium KBTZ08]